VSANRTCFSGVGFGFTMTWALCSAGSGL
jgi:hypothetical protein